MSSNQKSLQQQLTEVALASEKQTLPDIKKNNNLPLADYNTRKVLIHESCPKILVPEFERTGILVQCRTAQKEETKYPGILI